MSRTPRAPVVFGVDVGGPKKGFHAFAVGESIILSVAAMDLAASVPFFGVGAGMWAVALALISVPLAFPLIVRLLGLGTSVLFAATAGQVFAGVQILPMASHCRSTHILSSSRHSSAGFGRS